jgi:hypothetical protein
LEKKKAKPRLNRALVFRREWIFDPGPDILGLNRAGFAKVNQLKARFTQNVNAVIKQGQG